MRLRPDAIRPRSGKRTKEDVEQYVGLDVSLEQTAICVVDGSGKTIWQGKCVSTPEAIAAAIRAKAPEVARVGLALARAEEAWASGGLPGCASCQGGALAAAEQVRPQ